LIKITEQLRHIETVELEAEALEVASKKLFAEAKQLRDELRRWEEDDD